MRTRDVVIGATMGSTVMFLLDPGRGRRRRALVRDRAVRVFRRTRDALTTRGRDLTDRVAGVAAGARRRWMTEPVDDERLVARARAALGHVAAHPGAVEVEAQHGCVTVRGKVLTAEANAIIAAIAALPGVVDVADELDFDVRLDGTSWPQVLESGQGSWGVGSRRLAGAGLLAAGLWMALAGRRCEVGRAKDEVSRK